MLLGTACTSTPESEPVLLAGVATSIRPVVAELAARFEADHGISVTLVAGASGTLAEQLRQGAPFDLIVSADSRYTSSLTAEGLLDPDSIAVLATGELVAITNRDDPADDAATLLRDSTVQHVALANPDLAPYGDAARRYLQDQHLWKETAERVVYGENVAQVNSEAILTAAPDVVIEIRNEGTFGADTLAVERAVWERLTTLPAVRTGRVNFLSGGQFVVPGPRVLEAVEQLARLLHPEAF